MFDAGVCTVGLKGNNHDITHLGKRNIIFKSTLLMGHVSFQMFPGGYKVEEKNTKTWARNSGNV